MHTYVLIKRDFKATFVLGVFLLSILLPASISMAQFSTTSVLSQNSVALANVASEVIEMISADGDSLVPIIVSTETDVVAVIEEVKSLGGHIGIEYNNIKAFSASIPAKSIPKLAANVEVKWMSFDKEVELEDVGQQNSIPGLSDLELPLYRPLEMSEEMETVPLSKAAIEQILAEHPEGYWGFRDTKAADIWPLTDFGSGSIIAIIDTGCYENHPYLYPMVIEGPSFVPAEREPDGIVHSSVAVENHYHGTACAGNAIGSTAFLLPSDHWFVNMVRWEIPDAVIDGPGEYDGIEIPAGFSLIPLFGQAPLAQVYALKVFDILGGSTPTSIIMEAIDHAITMKKTGALDIDVISMSIGGWSLYDGRSAEEELVDEATEAGIVCSIAAGNSGPAPFTVERPGTTCTAVTVGAGYTPQQERMGWDLWGGVDLFDYLTTNVGASTGELLYVDPIKEIASYSSRGPTWDARMKPDIVAPTDAFTSVLIDTDGDGYNDAADWGTMGGTSASTPVVSGAAALLAAGFPEATPHEIKCALKGGAEPFGEDLGYGPHDYGAGWINLENTFELLDSGEEGWWCPPVCGWVDTICFEHGVYTADITSVLHGGKMEFNFWITSETDAIEIDFTDVVVEGPTNWLWEALALGTDSFEVYIQSPQHGGWYPYTYYLWSYNVNPGDEITFVIPFDLTSESGYVKIFVEGDWTNWSPVSGKITIRKISYAVSSLWGRPFVWNVWGYPIPTTTTIYDGEMYTFKDTIDQDDWLTYEVEVPEDTSLLFLELLWRYDWSRYPTNDLDAIIVDPGGNVYWDMATANAPEGVIITDPTPGTWTIYVQGYTVYKTDCFTLQATVILGLSEDNEGIAVATGTLPSGVEVMLGYTSVKRRWRSGCHFGTGMR